MSTNPDYHPNLDGPAEPIGLSLDDKCACDPAYNVTCAHHADYMGHEKGCDCAVCDDIAFRASLRGKPYTEPAAMELLRQKAQSKHDANCLLRLLLETLPLQLEQHKLTSDRTACAMLIQDSIDYLFRDGEDTLIESPTNDEQQALKLAYKMGGDSLKRKIEYWLNDTFEYENSVMTVHRVRETLALLAE